MARKMIKGYVYDKKKGQNVAPYTYTDAVLDRNGNTLDTLLNKVVSTDVIRITHSELVALRDNSQLKAGSWYRITDYECTTVQENTRSAGHRFDILVFAINENTLSEECKACCNEEYERCWVDDGDHCVNTGEKYIVTDAQGITKEATFFRCYEYDCYAGYFITGDREDWKNKTAELLWLNEDSSSTSIDVTNKTASTLVASFIDDWSEIITANFGYFSDSHLEAWKVWYTIDNDNKRFSWASVGIEGRNSHFSNGKKLRRCPKFDGKIDDVFYYAWGTTEDELDYDNTYLIYTEHENPYEIVRFYDPNLENEDAPLDSEGYPTVSPKGKGVIYRIIDEHHNDVAYDFKNIQFVRPLNYGEYNREGVDTYVYTFNGYNGKTGEIYDVSTIRFKLSKNTLDDIFADGNGNEQGEDMCRCNFIPPCAEIEKDYNNEHYRYALNEIVFLNKSVDLGYEQDYNVTFCQYNKFGETCRYITIGRDAIGNTFGCYNQKIVLGDLCMFNTVECNCHDIEFSYSNTYNKIGNRCTRMQFGANCSLNTLGNQSVGINLGGSCCQNSMCEVTNVNLGRGCKHNTFLRGSSNIKYGNKCCYNFIGEACDDIIFGTQTSVKDFYEYITIESGVHNICLNCTSTTSATMPVKNIHINSGVCGTYSNKKTIDVLATEIGHEFLFTYGTLSDVKINV